MVYRRFIRNFSSIIALVTECTKCGQFSWIVETKNSFAELKQKVECDAPWVSIGGGLNQNQRHVAYFSENLNETWRHYLLPAEYILYLAHESLKYLLGQQKLSPQHTKWVELSQAYSFVTEQKVGALIQITTALSCRHALVCTMKVKVTGFELWQPLYENGRDFRDI
ncbi:uncharacterized protein [Rutidosis leptorrhynchoides]|uniref:uncharacterized protein n=1 Tax=Rutidosis leptorrhynchoides TaxID=125765 RepID=UPI003A993E22